MTLGYNNEYLPALNEGDNETAQAQINANAAGSLSFIAGVLIVVWAVIMIILRILNIGALNIGSKYFLTIVRTTVWCSLILTFNIRILLLIRY